MKSIFFKEAVCFKGEHDKIPDAGKPCSIKNSHGIGFLFQVIEEMWISQERIGMSK
jgi:hypothetical protein